MQQGGADYEFNQASVDALSKNWLVADYAVGDTVRYKGNYYQANVAINASDNTAANFDNQNPEVSESWVSLGSSIDALEASGLSVPINRTGVISNEVANPTPTGNYFRESAFQATDETTNELINLLDDGLLNETFTVLQESADGSLPVDSVAPSWKQDIGVDAHWLVQSLFN